MGKLLHSVSFLSTVCYSLFFLSHVQCAKGSGSDVLTDNLGGLVNIGGSFLGTGNPNRKRENNWNNGKGLTDNNGNIPNYEPIADVGTTPNYKPPTDYDSFGSDMI